MIGSGGTTCCLRILTEIGQMGGTAIWLKLSENGRSSVNTVRGSALSEVAPDLTSPPFSANKRAISLILPEIVINAIKLDNSRASKRSRSSRALYALDAT